MSRIITNFGYFIFYFLFYLFNVRICKLMYMPADLDKLICLLAVVGDSLD